LLFLHLLFFLRCTLDARQGYLDSLEVDSNTSNTKKRRPLPPVFHAPSKTWFNFPELFLSGLHCKRCCRHLRLPVGRHMYYNFWYPDHWPQQSN